ERTETHRRTAVILRAPLPAPRGARLLVLVDRDPLATDVERPVPRRSLERPARHRLRHPSLGRRAVARHRTPAPAEPREDGLRPRIRRVRRFVLSNRLAAPDLADGHRDESR